MRIRNIALMVTSLSFLVSAQVKAQGYVSKDDGGDAQIPGCFSTYTPGSNCTGTPTLSGEGTIVNATSYNEALVAKTFSVVPPPPFPTVNRGPGACETVTSKWLVDCSAFCPAIGYASGTLATAVPSCGIAAQPYCACATPGAVIVDHANVVPASLSSPVGTCVQVDVQLFDASNAVVAAPATYQVSVLGGNATGTHYYSNATCTTNLSPARVTFAAGDTIKTVYYKNSAAGNVELQAMFPGLVPQTVTVNFF